MCFWCFPAYVFVPGVHSVIGHQKRVLPPMRLDIQVVVSYHVDAGNQTPKVLLTTGPLLQPLFACLI